MIAVDDRSTDATGAILDAIAAEEDRLRVVHVRELPGGWLGKTHALQSASEATSATWLLFSDADVILAPGALRRAVAWAEREGIDHVAVMFDVVTEGEGERIFLAFFGLMAAIYAPRWQVAARASRTHVGVGAFNLVRAEAFHAIGGFRRVALSVDDDMRLGQALKVAGYATRLVVGRGAVSVRWQVGLAGMIRGLEKNSFAVLDYRLPVALLALLAIVVIGMAPHAGLFVGPWWSRALCAVGIGSVALLLADPNGQSGVPWRHALTLPISAFVCAIALVARPGSPCGGAGSAGAITTTPSRSSGARPDAQRLGERGLEVDPLRGEVAGGLSRTRHRWWSDSRPGRGAIRAYA